ncbi:MAG: creatininase family protein [Chloroflexi bacterium]|jgi:creatinine amidohydrolase|nr:creatininase family protein [Chloroflexota bacterium]
MQWEHLTAADFADAVRQVGGVCVIAMGVIEKHGEHMPLGTDFLNGHKIACMAAEQEPAIVFPPFYFGQIYEARCFPGTLTIKPTLLLELVQSVFDEIARNGLKKIIIYNAHGGNNYLLPFLAQCTLWEEKAYSLYLPSDDLTPERAAQWQALRETDYGGHACEVEASITLANYPELVKMERVPETPARPLGRMKDLPRTYTGIRWYSDYPNHYAGDARTASAEKGRVWRQLIVDTLAEYIAAVKADQVVPSLNREFFERVRQVGQE